MGGRGFCFVASGEFHGQGWWEVVDILGWGVGGQAHHCGAFIH